MFLFSPLFSTLLCTSFSPTGTYEPPSVIPTTDTQLALLRLWGEFSMCMSENVNFRVDILVRWLALLPRSSFGSTSEREKSMSTEQKRQRKKDTRTTTHTDTKMAHAHAYRAYATTRMYLRKHIMTKIGKCGLMVPNHVALYLHAISLHWDTHTETKERENNINIRKNTNTNTQTNMNMNTNTGTNMNTNTNTNTNVNANVNKVSEVVSTLETAFAFLAGAPILNTNGTDSTSMITPSNAKTPIQPSFALFYLFESFPLHFVKFVPNFIQGIYVLRVCVYVLYVRHASKCVCWMSVFLF